MLVRLDRLPQLRRSLRVDRAGHGSIRGLSVITTGEALGHGFDVSAQAVEQVAQQLDGVPGRWTHGGLSDDGLARHLGHWRGGAVEQFSMCRPCGLEYVPSVAALSSAGREGYRCEGCGGEVESAKRVVGDFVFSKSAHSIKPDGLDVSAPEYLMQRAAEDPSTLGISIVAHFELEEVPVAELPDGSKETKTVGRLASIPRALRRADWVADPAANPVGLHAGTGALPALSEEATDQLNRIVRRVGREEARAKALAFLDRYFAHEEEPVTENASEAFNTVTGNSEAVGTKLVDLAEAPAPAKPEAPAPDAPKDGAEKCPHCGAEMAKAEAAMSALRAELDAAKVLASGSAAALDAANAKVAELEGKLSKSASERAVERIDTLREAGAKVGEHLTQEDRDEILGALTSSSDRERKLGESLLAKFKAGVEAAQGKQGARALANATKVDPEAERVKEQMLERANFEVVRDEHGRIDLSKCKPKQITKVGQ